MRYSEYLIWGAVVILLISVISIIVRKDEQRFLQTFFFLGFGAVFLYFVRLTDIDSDFWISDFHDLPLSRMYILCAIIIPLLAAGLTALLSFAVHRLADRRRNEIIIGAVYAAVVICLFQLESPLYDRVYEAAWISYYNRIVEEELTLIQGHGSEKDFSYLIPVSDELLGVGFVNEYGDQILMCQLDGFGPYGIIDGKFQIAVGGFQCKLIRLQWNSMRRSASMRRQANGIFSMKTACRQAISSTAIFLLFRKKKI